jgi:acetyl esterase
MRHSPIAMYPRTALLSALLDGLARHPIERQTLAQIQAGRGTVYPDRPPISWITGGGNRAVGVTFGTAQARDGYDIPVRIYRPRRVRDTETDVPVVVYLHGGGWVQGNVVMYDPLCMHLAEQVRAVVVSVDYRLAPEHRAPVAAHDAIDATRWVAGHGGALRADGRRLALCGDSAGGNLAAVVAQAFRDDHGPETSPIRHQALIYPATDLTMSSPSIDELAEAPMLTRRNMLALREHYAPAGTDYTDPILSPLFGDLEGLPPALIQTADLDPLRDDGIRYAEALRAAHVAVRLTNYLRVPHGFASYPGVVSTGAQHRAELVGELRTHLYAVGIPTAATGG